jgi:hypothetical protein
MSYQPPDAREIVKRGTDIYERKYRAEYEHKWGGRFAAINVNSEKAYVGDYPEEALAIAKRADREGIFYLVHIGSRTTFKSSRLTPNAYRRGV